MTSLDFSAILHPDDPPLPLAVMTESGLRSRDTAELRASLTPRLWDYGITRVANLTGLDNVGIPAHMAVKPQGRSLSSGSGKGSTVDASWVSAVMECAEQHVWEHLALDTVHASQSTLRRMGLRVTDGSLLPMLKGSLWSPDMAIDWTQGWDIVAGEPILVPDSLVTLAMKESRALRPFQSGSNGLASGAHVLEAVLSGLQEVIERDGMSLQTMVTPQPTQNADEFLRRIAPDLMERIERSNTRLEVIDARTELGIPTMVAYLLDDNTRVGAFKGAGAGTSNRTALIRAVTEAAQGRTLITAGARDDVFETVRSAATSVHATFSPAGTGQVPVKAFDDDFSAATGSIEGDIGWYVERLRAHGFEQVIVIRHTRPEEPVQVVRVIVPGLEGYPFATASPGPRASAWRRRAEGDVA